MNICIDNDSSRGNSSICNIFSSRRILIWDGIFTSEAFSLTEMIWFRLNSSWITVDYIKSRSQEKHVKLSSKFNSLLPHEMSSLFQCSLYHLQASKVISASGPLFFFCSSRKVTSKNLPLVSCFEKSNFCWQPAGIRLPYHLGSIYAKWLVLNAK